MKETLKQILELLKSINFKNSSIRKNKKNYNIDYIVSSLRKKGYFKIEDYYSKNLCDEITKKIDQIIDEKLHLFKIDEKSNDFRLNGADRISSKINIFNKDLFLNHIAEKFIGEEIDSFFTLAAKIENKNGKLGSGGDWHRDKPLPNQIKAMIYLNDVDQENGPFEYLEGSNSWFSLLDGTFNFGLNNCQTRLDNNVIESKFLTKKRYVKKVFYAKKGTLLLFNSFGIHRGKPLESGKRYALTNYYFPSSLVAENLEDLTLKFKLPEIYE